MVQVNEALKSRRVDLGLSDVDASKKTGLSIYEYGDLEAYPHEFFEQISMKQAKKVCEVLGLDIKTFLPECSDTASSKSIARNLLVTQERERTGLTKEQLAEKIGYEAIAIEEVEAASDNIDSLCLAAVIDIAKVLKINPCLLV